MNQILPNLSQDNVCQNKLTISGPVEELNRFIDDNKSAMGKNLSLAQSVPVPEHYDSEKAKIWTAENWGMTKDIDKIFNNLTWYKNKLYLSRSISFASQDIPLYPWLLKIAPQYPKINFELEFIDMANYRYGKFSVIEGVFRDINLTHQLDKAFTIVKTYYEAFNDIKPAYARDAQIWTYINSIKNKNLFEFLEENNEISHFIQKLDNKASALL